jgi:UDPglucose--hexose-1-phosphate uridylyltransferase
MPDTVAVALATLLAFAEEHGLIGPEDRRWAANLLLDALGYAASAPSPAEAATPPPTATPMLAVLCADAASRGIIAASAVWRELFSARLMGLLTPPPSALAERFAGLRADTGPQAATDWFYALQRANDYIRVDAIAQNVRFLHPSPYGELEITINLSKPEKDPRDIAALRDAPQAGYPKCMLCIENQGYAGRLAFPARQTLRLLPLTLCGEPWHFQYSPYSYYPEHCIALSDEHRPMAITRGTFARLFAFLEQFPHYFIGSNADLPIVGGSVLNHDHFQGGRHALPMQAAPAYAEARPPGAPGVRVSLVAWPMTTLRLTGSRADEICGLAERVLDAWRVYSDAEAGVLASTEETPHNTVTPILRRAEGEWILDLVLRNNRTSREHPLGLFHPHAPLHHIKKENIGLIEVMGLFVLPGRLREELAKLEDCLTGARALTPPPPTEGDLVQHWPWITELVERHGARHSAEEARAILRAGLAEVCVEVLWDSGVFKLDEAGKAAARRFCLSVGFQF